MTELDKAARADELAALETRTDEQQAELDALTEELTAPKPGPVNTTPATKKATSSKRYAAYNKTLERFQGGVHETKAEAQEVAKHNADKHKFEIREVD